MIENLYKLKNRTIENEVSKLKIKLKINRKYKFLYYVNLNLKINRNYILNIFVLNRYYKKRIIEDSSNIEINEINFLTYDFYSINQKDFNKR